MKIIFFILFIFLSFFPVKSQTNLFINIPLLKGDKTYKEHCTNKKGVESIYHNGQLIFAEIKNEGGNIKYFKADDTTFIYRETSNHEIINEGPLTLKTPPIKVDTISSFDPETLKDDNRIESYFLLEKNGEWYETQNDSTFWLGKYIKGKRTGRWFKSLDKTRYVKYLEYENDNITTIYKPDSFYVKNFINWILNKNLYFCLKSNREEISGEKNEIWRLNENPGKDCQNYGKFVFKEDGTFEYKHRSEFKIEVQKYDGKGNWKINTLGKLVLKFANKERNDFEIELLGIDRLTIIKR